jgi:hypothetical protein
LLGIRSLLVLDNFFGTLFNLTKLTETDDEVFLQLIRSGTKESEQDDNGLYDQLLDQSQ